MAEKFNISPDDVSIDSDGKVVIANKEFTKALLARVESGAGLGPVGIFDNCNCGGSVADLAARVTLPRAGAVRLSEMLRGRGPNPVGFFDNCDCR